jgi:biopolymer transport protein ExbB/TolQ
MLTQKLMRLTVAGGSEWVMLLLLALSVVSIAIITERMLFLRRRRRSLDGLDQILGPLIQEEDTAGMRKALAQGRQPSLQAALAGHERVPPDREATEKIVASSLGRERLSLERRLTFLGTLGNNAPFIGLFGTVLGIIRAFHDLSLESKANTSAVMAGISEALVATAVGLFVAIPAVLFYNYFQRQVDRTLAIIESLAQGILAGLPRSTPIPPERTVPASAERTAAASAPEA